MIHKSPLVYYECDDIYYDTVRLYNLTQGLVNYNAFDYLKILENMLINYYDVSQEFRQAKTSLESEDYYTMGQMFG